MLGRNTQGVKLINLGEGQQLAGIERIIALNGDDDEVEPDDSADGAPPDENGSPEE